MNEITVIKNDWLDEILETSKMTLDHRFKKWAKYIDSCDMSRDDGYLFEGDWIHQGTVQVPTGHHKLILVCAESGTNKYHYRHFRILIMKPDTKLMRTEIFTDDSDKGWALRIRDAVCEMLDQVSLWDKGTLSMADQVRVAAESFEAALSRLPQDKWVAWYRWLLVDKDEDFLAEVREMVTEMIEGGNDVPNND